MRRISQNQGIGILTIFGGLFVVVGFFMLFDKYKSGEGAEMILGGLAAIGISFLRSSQINNKK